MIKAIDIEMNTNPFAELKQSLSIQEAIDEAKRCLNCRNPLCVQGCPIEHDIPGFLQQLSMGNVGGAMQIINEKSSLPAVCGRVCPHEKQCEGHCILNRKHKPIKVGLLERFIADFDSDMKLIKERLKPKTRGKVAVIGSGPAGLSVASDLAKSGFNVVVFEGLREAGGVLMYGIPEYRLPRNIVRREVAKIEALGVIFNTNCFVGETITVDQIFEQGFDAIFIGTGTSSAKTMNIPGADLNGVMQASFFLEQVSLAQQGSIPAEDIPMRSGDRIAVVGAGNVAMDAARTAVRLGGKVTIVYRRTAEVMPALKSEYEEALEEGVEFMFETKSKEFLGEGGKVTAIRADLADGSEALLPFDKVLIAIGSQPADRIVSTTSGIEVGEGGYVITKEQPYGMTTRNGIFAAGDVVHTPQTVVLAMREAKKVAKSIAEYVDAVKLLAEE